MLLCFFFWKYFPSPFIYFSFSKGPKRWWSVELFHSHIKLCELNNGASFLPFLSNFILATSIHVCCGTIADEPWPSHLFLVLSLNIPADEHLPTSLKYITVTEGKIPGEIPKKEKAEVCKVCDPSQTQRGNENANPRYPGPIWLIWTSKIGNFPKKINRNFHWQNPEGF